MARLIHAFPDFTQVESSRAYRICGALLALMLLLTAAYPPAERTMGDVHAIMIWKYSGDPGAKALPEIHRDYAQTAFEERARSE